MSERDLIAHLDDEVIVVDKPPGLVVHPAPSYEGETLVDRLGDLAGGGLDWRPGIVHRLDRDTSGLMVVARTEEAHRKLAAQIKEREVGREYVALVDGRPKSRTGSIDAPIGRHRRRRALMAVRGSASREARTHFEVIEPLPRDTLVAVRLETGRTHQIRVHFEAIGHPVVGDPDYGKVRRYGLERQFLHSRRLTFEHPGTGEELTFESPLPPDLAGALEAARSADAL